MEFHELRYLALLRHGESEGDVRRTRQRAGETVVSTKTPEEEGLTSDGWACSQAAGAWIQEYILNPRGWPSFDIQRTSPSIRCLQTADALGLGAFDADVLLEERNRGEVRGLSPQEHQTRFPESYAAMQANPLHWRPPGQGSETIAVEVAQRTKEALGSLVGVRSALIVTHRDTIWSFLGLLGGWDDIDTDYITNNVFIEYSRLHPGCGGMDWVRWSCPEAGPPAPDSWVRLGATAFAGTGEQTVR